MTDMIYNTAELYNLYKYTNLHATDGKGVYFKI